MRHFNPHPSSSTGRGILAGLVKIGCCGFPVARRKYYSEFGVVEVQQTFYHPPEDRTLERWRREAPQGFEYTVKAWQVITHPPSSPTYRRLKMKIHEDKKELYGFFRPTDEVFMAWGRMEEVLRILGARVIVFQTPASFLPTEENIKNMERFFTYIKRDGFVLAWEPRGRWKDGEIKDICNGLDLVHTVDPFKSRPLHGSIRYYRLHGIGGYRYRFTPEDLERLRDLVDRKKTTYVMFNNVYMYQDALNFIHMESLPQ